MPHPARFERVTAAFGEPNHWRLVGNAEMVLRKYRVFVSCGCGTNSVGISCPPPLWGPIRRLSFKAANDHPRRRSAEGTERSSASSAWTERGIPDGVAVTW